MPARLKMLIIAILLFPLASGELAGEIDLTFLAWSDQHVKADGDAEHLWAAIAGMAGVLILMAFSKSRVELLASVIVTAVFSIAYAVHSRSTARNAPHRAA